MEMTFIEKLDIIGQAMQKMGVELVLPIAIGMVLLMAGERVWRTMQSGKAVPVRVRDRRED